MKSLIVGAGINGLAVAFELWKKGEEVYLVDKKKILSQTSSKSSKMLHGGIRYLEQFHFDLVSEALFERNYWSALRPDLCTEKKFFIPIYKSSPHGLLESYLGVKLYDFLARKKDAQIFSKDQTLKLIPSLNAHGLRGAVTYSDVIIDDYLFAKEVFAPILNNQKNVKTYEETTLSKLKIGADKKITATIINNELQENIKLDRVIFTTGPFTDQVLAELEIPWKKKLNLSRGAHLFLRKDLMELNSPLIIQDHKRVIFLIPHKDYHLLGTTEGEQKDRDSLFDLNVSPFEKNYLIVNFEKYFPKIKIRDEDIIKQTCGIRPLVDSSGSTGLGNIDRTHRIFSPLPNHYVLIGGKYTTFRKMATDLVEQIERIEG
jgi:glycerol-3-phosphate dehydrogenase